MSSIEMVVISIEGDAVPIMFPIEDDGYAEVSACRLALRFCIIPESIYIDQNIYDTTPVSSLIPLDRLRHRLVLGELGDFCLGSSLHMD